MPNIPLPPAALPGQVFWSVGDLLSFSRFLLNDMQGGEAGQDLSDDQPYTLWLVNLAYANLQNALEDTNVEAVTIQEAVVGPLTAAPTAGIDPNVQIRLGYEGYYDGTNETDPTVTLPGDLLQPMELWERPSGSTQPFLPMQQVYGGIQARWGLGMVYGSARLGVWEFRGDQGTPALFFPGVNTATEIRIRYIPSLPLLQRNQDGTWPQLPLARAGEALAYGIAAEFAESRAASNAPMLRQKYEDQVRIISNKAAKRESAGSTRMRGYGFSRRPRSRFY